MDLVSVTTKPEILKLLRNSFAYLHKAIATVNDKNFMERVEFGATPLPRLMIVTAAISHPWDLYGQMIEYLRMNGIDPQHLRSHIERRSVTACLEGIQE